MSKNKYYDGMLGLIVGDSLGVPVEFSSREERVVAPVTGMVGYGTHHQPAGTWSDDSSMALATLISIQEMGGIDYQDIMERFSDWCMNGDYTPFGEVFDIGNSTMKAIMNYAKGKEPTECGGTSEYENGNGSLMRILPVCLYVYEREKNGEFEWDLMSYIWKASKLTHAHITSITACCMYYYFVRAILDGDGSLLERLQKGVEDNLDFFFNCKCYTEEYSLYGRLRDLDAFSKLPITEIKSSGYVVDTLEAAVWCLLTTSSYREAVLKAVNLGDDTDTVAAVTGGLAGLYYGGETIPQEWVDVLQRKYWVMNTIGADDAR